MERNTKAHILLVAIVATLIVALGSTSFVGASSHREAPMIGGDPKADATDLYAFKSPTNPDNVVLIANYTPFQEPAGGPNFYTFDDNARYEINIDNNGDSEANITYRFEFDSSYQDVNTFLYATGPVTSLDDENLNYRQTYTLTKIEDGVETVLVTDAKVPPSNIGTKTLPEDSTDYLSLQAEAYTDLPSGGQVFAGQSEDAFFVDLGGAFDLLNVRELPGNNGGGIDTLAGYNVHSLVLELPMSEVTSDGSTPDDATDPAAVIGTWTTSLRQATTVLVGDGSQTQDGDWIQVSRLGQPLVNEVVVPVGLKDAFNAIPPSADRTIEAVVNKVVDPEFPQILNLLFGIEVPPQGISGSGDERDDLFTIFLTGIEGLNQPADVVPSEQLRLNLAIPVTDADSSSRLGVIDGDVQGFPNGRRLGDDVIDIALRVMAGAAYPLFHPEFTVDPVGAQLGDGVDENEVEFQSEFPYVGAPYSGIESIPHENARVDTFTDVYRFYSDSKKTHFYTISKAERNSILQNDKSWDFEGEAFTASSEASASSPSPVYRFYSENYGGHFYTISEQEKDALIANDPNWAFEGIAYYARTDGSMNTQTVFRFYSDVFKSHFFTTSVEEKENLEQNDSNWNYEGEAYYLPLM